MPIYNICGQIIELNIDTELIHNNFKIFLFNRPAKPDLNISLTFYDDFTIPNHPLLISSSYLSIYYNSLQYTFIYQLESIYLYMVYYTDCNKVDIFLSRNATHILYDFRRKKPESTITTNIVEHIFSSIRDVFFLFIQTKNMIALHSSAIIYNNKAYLFSACSGTGKTTHTNIWKELYDISILNGDISVISNEKSIPMVLGIPWCGSSNAFSNTNITLGGIFFLKQNTVNSIQKLSHFDSILNICARCFTPNWSSTMFDINLTIAAALAPKILLAELSCLPNENAVNLVKDYIDKNSAI